MKQAALLMALLLVFGDAKAQAPTASRWYKGNLHAHTVNSDGDSSPIDAVAWYKLNGYQFVAITDHNRFTDPGLVAPSLADDFLLIPAEEITNERTVHVNAIGISRVIPPQRGATVTEILQASIDATREQGGVPIINHPNFLWAFTATEMRPLKGAFLLEIASGHPGVNHDGDGRVPATEQMWDQLLSAGRRIFAVSVDDVHNFRQEFTIERANPGRGWVVVRAPTLTVAAVVGALTRGDFYASTGVEIKDIQSTAGSLTVEIQPPSGRAPGQTASTRVTFQKRYRVVFIGKEGRVLAVSYENPASYRFSGNEGYVRARVEDSGGLKAWTQPVFVEAPR